MQREYSGPAYLLGADHIIDYTKEDFIKRSQRYDLIVATAGFRSIHDYKSALNQEGDLCLHWRRLAAGFSDFDPR